MRQNFKIYLIAGINDEEDLNEANENEVEEEDEEDDYNDDDIVIVSKLNLNLPPVQYSKQFYDLNMNGFEHELKRFGAGSVSSCSSSPASTNAITTVTKSVVRPIPINKQPLPASNPQQRPRFNMRNGNQSRQRFIHYIITNRHDHSDKKAFLKAAPFTGDNVINPLDVDSLKHLRQKSKSTSFSLANGNYINEIRCHEIHAGGFRCIEEHQFQRSINYLRRTQSFTPHAGYAGAKTPLKLEPKQLDMLNSSVSNDSFSFGCQESFHASKQMNESLHASMMMMRAQSAAEASANQKKISLNDYVSSRVKSSATSTPQLNNCNASSYPSSVNSCDVPAASAHPIGHEEQILNDKIGNNKKFFVLNVEMLI